MISCHLITAPREKNMGKGGKGVAPGQAGMTKHYHFKGFQCQKRQFKGVLHYKSFQVMECKF